MSIANEIFRKAGLTPTAAKHGIGYCECDPRTKTMLFKTSSNVRCDVCSSLNQTYPFVGKDGVTGATRMTDGSFMLITPTRIIYWGNCRLNQINPQIEVRPATGEMSNVQRGIILNPPDTPWMVYSFGKSNSSATLRVTEDNRLLRFGGKMHIKKRVVAEINRDQLMQMLSVGMSAKEWEACMAEFAMQRSRKVMAELEAKYPTLADIRWLPQFNSAEYLALDFILKGVEKASKAKKENTDGAM